MSESTLIATSTITETICQVFSDPMVDIRSRGIVEVATDKDRIRGAFDLDTNRICLICSFPIVVFHFQDQIFGSFCSDFQGLAGSGNDAAIGVDACCFEMVVDHTDISIVYSYIGYHRHVPEVFIINSFYLMDRITAIDCHRRMIRAFADILVWYIIECLPDTIPMVIPVAGGFLEANDIGL